MQQYFAKNKNLDLEDSDYHHIKHVMKMKCGDLIKIVFDDTLYMCKLNNINDISFEVIDKIIQNKKKQKQIDVAFSLIKEQKLNYLLQKTTELGVNRIIPIETKRSVVKIENKKRSLKIERWKKILKEASEQSFRNEIPKINDISNLKELVNMNYDLKLLCSLNKNTKNIKKVLPKFDNCVKILLVVGPEGGFDLNEEEYLLSNGFVSISLGDTVLRAETAPVVALSMMNYEFMR